MNEVIIYLMKVIAIQGLFYLFYRLVLRNTGHHSFNRCYLLLSLLTAFFIPFVELSLPEKVQTTEEIPVIMWLSEPQTSIEEFELIPVKHEASSSYWYLIPWLYGLVVFVLLVRSVFYLALLARLKKQSEYIKKRWFKLFKISQDRPFSFFSSVFMPKTLFGSEAFDQILTHECEHVRQLHSIDRLLMDFVVSLFWFNPFIYLYRNALIEIHEFQADEVVLTRFNDPVGYQEILFSQLQSAQYSGLVSHFNFSMIKKRIVMMNKQHKMSGWVYALTAPVTLMVVFAFSSKEAMEPINDVGDEIAAMLGPENGLEWPDFTLSDSPKKETLSYFESKGQSKKNVPEIAPVRNKDLVRLTSGFGIRIHPIDKVEKMHKGVDFSCRVGSEVLATTNGVVSSIETKFGGYGKMITINHGDGYITRYAQLSEFKVEEGNEVKKGDVIGLSGNSGASTAPHLHYEVIKDGEHVDPINYIKDYSFQKVNNGSQDYRPSILPLKNTSGVRMTSGFGMRMHPVDKVKQMHKGIDFATPIGNPVLATADGTVHNATYKEGYGNFILIDHGDKYMTRYSQLSEMNVKRGDKVSRGQVIGKSGNSGKSTGPHLHYEVIKVGEGHVDPMDYIENYNFKAMVDPKEEDLIEQERELAQQQKTLTEKERDLMEQERELAEKHAVLLQQEREIEEERGMELKVEQEKVFLKYKEQEMRRALSDSLEPLLVLNGVIVLGVDGLEDLDVRNIQSITVLKGKNAKKMYGDMGKNGVVEITTKDKSKNKNKQKNKDKSKDKDKLKKLAYDLKMNYDLDLDLMLKTQYEILTNR